MSDEALLSHVRPADWRNPTPRSRYDLVVIGAGTAGLVTAAGAAGLGAKVALVERDRMGGDCLNVGCVPSKGIIAAARIAANARRGTEYGVTAADVRVDFATVMERMRRLRASLAPHDSAARFQSLGVDVFFGEANFVSGDAVAVDGSTLRFKRAAICTGARAAVPAVPGLNEARFLTNESVFDLAELPRRLLILGGGPIGCELAQAFARFGSEVTLVERGKRLLPKDDSAASNIVQQALERDGVRVRTSCAAVRFDVGASGHQVQLEHATESAQTSETPLSPFDAVLVAAGRQPNVEMLDLANAHVEFNPQSGITVDARLRTTNTRIYAAGDVCSRFKFTHAADAMARIVIQNALFLGRKKATALTIPWCTYTSPEVAQVGLTEEQAKHDGVTVDTFLQPLSSVDRNVLDGDTTGFVKVHVQQRSDRILGGTIVDEHAGDLIGYLAHAMTHGLGLKAFSSTVFPYPTRSEALRKLGDAYNRTRLTPTAKKTLSAWVRWTR